MKYGDSPLYKKRKESFEEKMKKEFDQRREDILKSRLSIPLHSEEWKK
jgi:flagellar basal body rod protein FlgB